MIVKDKFGKSIMVQCLKISSAYGTRIISTDEHFGLCDENFNIICDIKYDYIFNEYNNKFKCILNKLYGVLDYNGNEIISPIYNNINFFNNLPNHYSIKNNKVGIVYNNRIIIPCNYNNIVEYKHFFITQDKSSNSPKYEAYDLDGNLIIDEQNTYPYVTKLVDNYIQLKLKLKKLDYVIGD
jgi:hypothetical protein